MGYKCYVTLAIKRRLLTKGQSDMENEDRVVVLDEEDIEFIDEAVGEMLNIYNLYTRDGLTSNEGLRLLKEEFESVPMDLRRPTFEIFLDALQTQGETYQPEQFQRTVH